MIETQDKKQHLFRTTTLEDKKNWVSALRLHMPKMEALTESDVPQQSPTIVSTQKKMDESPEETFSSHSSLDMNDQRSPSFSTLQLIEQSDDEDEDISSTNNRGSPSRRNNTRKKTADQDEEDSDEA